ncbi:hypothetical protein VIGAN_11026100 [Vigna angularis var. angularis]|uniref:Uncharacterized protein n=1 Tax=Vigna angularis var. angularis TaxID=157739 RepID=A0A0S3T775_PHAAN|nr:hypothetical protein VIGAN_11026100 [Vigna angularis var. angularis]
MDPTALQSHCRGVSLDHTQDDKSGDVAGGNDLDEIPYGEDAGAKVLKRKDEGAETMEKLNLNRSGSVPSGVLRTNFKPKTMVSAPMDSIRSEC